MGFEVQHTKVNHNYKLNNVNKINLNKQSLKTHYEYENINYDGPIDYLTDFSKTPIDYSNIADEGYEPQGMSAVNGDIFITGYKKGENSKVYIYDQETGKFKGKINLDNNAHVGGVTIDEKNGILYITGSNGKVNAYDLDKLQTSVDEVSDITGKPYTFDIPSIEKNGSESSAYIIPNDITIEDYGKAATTYYHDGYIYTATFEGEYNGIIVANKVDVSYDENGNKIITIDHEKSKTFPAPKQTQGIAITEYDGKKYLLVSQSVGIAKSNLLVYEYNEKTKEFDYLGKTYENRGMEGIHVDEDGNITAVFENGRTTTLNTTMDKVLNSISKRQRWMQELFAQVGGVVYEHDSEIKSIVESFKSAFKDFSNNPNDFDTLQNIGTTTFKASQSIIGILDDAFENLQLNFQQEIASNPNLTAADIVSRCQTIMVELGIEVLETIGGH